MQKKADLKYFALLYRHLQNKNEVASLKDLSDTIGYPAANLSLIFNGKRSIPHSLVNLLAEKFNVSRAFLYDGKEPMFIDPQTANNQFQLLQKSNRDELMQTIISQQDTIQKLSTAIQILSTKLKEL